MEKETKSKTIWTLYLVVIFVLSAILGFFAKTMALPALTSGFDDGKIKAVTSPYSFQEIEKNVKAQQEALQKEQEAAQQEQIQAFDAAQQQAVDQGSAASE